MTAHRLRSKLLLKYLFFSKYSFLLIYIINFTCIKLWTSDASNLLCDSAPPSCHHQGVLSVPNVPKHVGDYWCLTYIYIYIYIGACKVGYIT